jgi:hypothetical protein
LECADSAAAKSNSLECFKYILENTISWNTLSLTNLTEIAAEAGSINILQYLHEKGQISEWSGAAKYAAMGGSLECLKFLLDDVGCLYTEKVCRYAAANGHLDCLRFAVEKRCTLDVIVCQWAAENNELDCLKYAHEHDCPWDKYACKAAAVGSLECLKYLHENQCPWDKETVVAAWGCKCPNRLPHPYTYSCMVWGLNMVGPSGEWRKVFTEADAKDALYPECFRYAVSNGCPIPHPEDYD